jgi:hypothetical protein
LAYERKPRLSAAEFRFDPIVSSEPASRRSRRVLVSAQSETLAGDAEMLLVAGKQVRLGFALAIHP